MMVTEVNKVTLMLWIQLVLSRALLKKKTYDNESNSGDALLSFGWTIIGRTKRYFELWSENSVSVRFGTELSRFEASSKPSEVLGHIRTDS